MVAMAEVKTVMPQAHAHPEKHPESKDLHRFDYQPDEHQGQSRAKGTRF
jgi:hypothetical protein